MKNKFSRFFYILCSLAFIVLFAIFCAFAGGAGGWEPKNASVSLTLEKSDKTLFCGGFVTGKYVITCAHLFANEQLDICEKELMCKGSFVHIPEKLFIEYEKKRLLFKCIYADFSSDVAVIELTSVFPEVKFASIVKNETLFAPTGNKVSYEKVKSFGSVSLGAAERLKLDYAAEKGLSGYPVYNLSGYVNGIICSFDKMNETTYAVPGDSIVSVIGEYEKIMKA